MVRFNFGRKDKVIDLTEHLKKQQERVQEMKEDLKESPQPTSSSNGLGFFGSIASTIKSTPEPESSNESYTDFSEGADEKRKRLAKRLIDMTSKLEDISNQIYHLQQRIEVLERKTNINSY